LCRRWNLSGPETPLAGRKSKMALWNDRELWSALCSGAGCPICRRGEPLELLAKLEASWLTMSEVAPVPGYVCLVSQTHAVDLHDLPDAAASAFMRDAQKVSMAVASVTGAVKMNYEVHGNSIPHLHMHFFPRYRGDRFEGEPINPRLVVPSVYGPGEFERTRAALARALFPKEPSSGG
jgi:diadenosine tetraphosphate (Ap4A) HIT family hydrolase